MDVLTPATTFVQGRRGGIAPHFVSSEMHMIEQARLDLHARFAAHFVDSHALRHVVTLRELTILSRLLSTQLPGAYVEFLRRHGAVTCHAVLRSIVERRLGYPDLCRFLDPGAVLKLSRELWCGQLPVDVYAFAVDSMGNAFCFRQSRMAQDDAPVLLFSLACQKLTPLCDSFDGLLNWYDRNA